MKQLGKRSLQSLEGIHPELVKLMKAAITDSPIDFTITDGLRTVAQQQALYAKGRTKPGGVVTNADGVKLKSNHQGGKAVDLYPYINGSVDFNDVHGHLTTIAAHIKSVAKSLGISIRWGGDFKATKTKAKGWDKPHFELHP